jgi:hypothetical protein
MPKKIQHTTKGTLISVPLPQHGASYTVISHQFVIDYAYQALAAAGFGIVDEEYRCTADGQIAQGIYKLNFNNDPELSMMFAWTNSYNKQVKFKCVVGAYINKTGSVMISGDIGSWVRKHTGTADAETKSTIDSYIANAHMYYTQLCSDKAAMENITLNKRKQSQLLGVLFAEYEILTTEQASMVRDQMKKPYQVFANTDSLWAFYNYVTNALQSSHPKTWMEDQRILHYFISSINNFQTVPATPVIVPEPSEPSEPVDPLTTNYGEPENQTNLLVQIAEATGDESVLEPSLPVEPADYDFNQTVDYSKAIHPVTEEDAFSMAQLAGVKAPEDLDAEEDEDWNKLESEGVIAPCAAHDLETVKEEETLELTEEVVAETIAPLFEEAPEETVMYTDPIGNTFEAPVIDVVELNDHTTTPVLVVENAEETDEAIFAEEDNFSLDFTEDTNEDPDELPDFF